MLPIYHKQYYCTFRFAKAFVDPETSRTTFIWEFYEMNVVRDVQLVSLPETADTYVGYGLKWKMNSWSTYTL